MKCKACGEYKVSGDFYASRPSVCKECVKLAVRENRAAKLEYYQSYDRKRYREQPKRKEAARVCAASDAGVLARRLSAERNKGTEKRKAQVTVGNAIRDGKIKKGSECFFCGKADKLHAHHPDYSRPFDVFWLCPPCHGKLHTINGDFLKKNKKDGVA